MAEFALGVSPRFLCGSIEPVAHTLKPRSYQSVSIGDFRAKFAT